MLVLYYHFCNTEEKCLYKLYRRNYYENFKDSDYGYRYGDASIDTTNELFAITDVITVENVSVGQVESGSFFRSTPQGKYITIFIQGAKSCTVTVNGYSRYLTSGSGYYTICAAGENTTGYSIRFHEACPVVVYTFCCTDNYYG